MLKETYDEQYRPTFHFTEKETFINDPNGLVYDSNTGIYHMFYQYHPGITAEGSLYWGHAVSKDLVRWERKEKNYNNKASNLGMKTSKILEKLFNKSINIIFNELESAITNNWQISKKMV